MSRVSHPGRKCTRDLLRLFSPSCKEEVVFVRNLSRKHARNRAPLYRKFNSQAAAIALAAAAAARASALEARRRGDLRHARAGVRRPRALALSLRSPARRAASPPPSRPADRNGSLFGSRFRTQVPDTSVNVLAAPLAAGRGCHHATARNSVPAMCIIAECEPIRATGWSEFREDGAT